VFSLSRLNLCLSINTANGVRFKLSRITKPLDHERAKDAKKQWKGEASAGKILSISVTHVADASPLLDKSRRGGKEVPGLTFT
jgi:hypothetical protein